jgi:hypothetical protein
MLAAVFCASSPQAAQAQPDVNNAPKAENPGNGRQRANRRNRANRPGANGEQALQRAVERDLTAAELIAGKPLTDEQKQKVREATALRENAVQAAREKYLTDLAQATGIEIDEVRLKMRQATLRQRLNGQRLNGQGANGAAGQNGQARRRNRRNNPNAAPANGAAQVQAQ